MKKQLKVLKEITPKEMSCLVGGCPAIFETNKDSYLLIGKAIKPEKVGLSNKVAKDEILIEVPKNLIDNKN